MINGFININKHSGISSNKVLGILKYNLHKIGIKDKVGHLGTLDPLAEGVLPVAIGRATRLFDYSLKKIKKYEAEFIFGATSESLDTDTLVTYDKYFVMPEISFLKDSIQSQIGEINQIPPKFSAKSVNGVRAYKMARAGEEVSLPAKKIKIYDIQLLDVNKNKIKVDITCGGGTYVRAIGRDIADKINTNAVMCSLKRTQSGCFHIEKAISLDLIEHNPQILLENIIPMEEFLADYPRYNISAEDKKKLLNGKSVEKNDFPNENAAVYCENILCGIGINLNNIIQMKTWLI